VREDDVSLHPDGIWIPVYAIRSTAVDLVVEVIVHIEDIKPMSCHNVGGALVGLHNVEPHAVPLECRVFDEQTGPDINRYRRSCHPDNLSPRLQCTFEQPHQILNVLVVVFDSTRAPTIYVPEGRVDDHDVRVRAVRSHVISYETFGLRGGSS